MAKEFEANENWIARDEGRIPTKGAMAAERASAGLGATDHEAAFLEQQLPPRARLARPAPRSAKRIGH
jgi:hypothetical protein